MDDARAERSLPCVPDNFEAQDLLHLLQLKP